MLQFQPGDNMIEGETGGYNTTNGETITFSVITDPTQTISGTIDVVFASPDGLFSDVTVTLNIVNNVWARSNIVWVSKPNDPNYPEGGYLTFAVTPADNATIPANSQGVFFQWGSLVAISPHRFQGQQIRAITLVNIRAVIFFSIPDQAVLPIITHGQTFLISVKQLVSSEHTMRMLSKITARTVPASMLQLVKVIFAAIFLPGIG